MKLKMQGILSLALVSATFSATASTFVAGCSDAEPDPFVAIDGGQDGAVAPALDAGTDADALPDANGGSPWLLLTLNYDEHSELVPFNLTTRAAEGRLRYDGSLGGTYVDQADTWLLQQQSDIVVRLDPNAPWNGGPSWNVHLDDAYDGGQPNANPIAVVAGPPGKAYVVRYNRNRIAVLDTTANADGGLPSKSIDLSSFLDGADSDGAVEVAGAVYSASAQRLYVILGNVDLGNVDPDGFFTLCGASKPMVVAVDTTTDELAPAVVPGGAQAIELEGYNPVFNSLVLDAPRNRLLAIHGGCHLPGPSVGLKGEPQRRWVEAISLTNGAVSTALDLLDAGYVAAKARLDGDHLVLGVYPDSTPFEAFTWDLRTATAGPAIAGVPSLFAYDGTDALVGVQTDYAPDYSSFTSKVVSKKLDSADAGVEILGDVVYSEPSSIPPTGADYLPAPN